MALQTAIFEQDLCALCDVLHMDRINSISIRENDGDARKINQLLKVAKNTVANV